MLRIYVDMSSATEAEKNALRASDILGSMKAALEQKAVPVDVSVTFTAEQVIEPGRILTTIASAGVSPGSVGRAATTAADAINKAKS